MAKHSKRFTTDPRQISIFELIRQSQDQKTDQFDRKFDIDRELRDAVSAALKRCPLSRYQVVARMSELLDQDITKTMLDSWTAESKEHHRFPAVFLPAFCSAVGDSTPLAILARPVGVFMLPGTEALRAEIRRLDEEICERKKAKQKREVFLQGIEEQRL